MDKNDEIDNKLEEEIGQNKIPKFGAKQALIKHRKIKAAIEKELNLILEDPFFKSSMIEE